MQNFPPIYPVTLRALICYEISQQKSAEISYKKYQKLCENTKTDAISFGEYEKMFNRRCTRRSYDKEEVESADSIIWCILSDVIHKKPIEKSYKELCKAFGIPMINHMDIEKCYETCELRLASKNLKFTDLPFDTIRVIMEKVDLKTQLNLRKVSCGLRYLVDHTKPTLNNIIFKYESDDIILVDFDEKGVMFTKPSADSHRELEPAIKIVESEDFKKIAFDDVGGLFKNSRLKLKWFCVEAKDKIQQYKSHPDQIIHVERNCIANIHETDVISILKSMKPGILRRIMVVDGDSWMMKWGKNSFGKLDQLVELDQWKHAKHLVFNYTFTSSIDHLLHFKTVDIHLESIKIEDFIKIRDNAIESLNFRSFSFSTSQKSNIPEIVQKLNLIALDADEEGRTHFYRIPDSDDVLNFWLKSRYIYISK